MEWIIKLEGQQIANKILPYGSVQFEIIGRNGCL